MIQVNKLYFQPNYANSYLLIKDGAALLIDPGYNKNHVLEKAIERSGAKLAGILITHGHFDHIAGLMNFEHLEQIVTFYHPFDEDLFLDPSLNCSLLFEEGEVKVKIANGYRMEDEDDIKIGPFRFQVIHTPFHTKGSVCFYFGEDKLLFSGDTLFKNGIGRSDLPSSCPRFQANSLNRLKGLPNEVKVYPGHGVSTTIGDEKRYNPEFQ